MAEIIGYGVTISFNGVTLGAIAPEPVAIRLPQELLDDAAALAPVRAEFNRRGVEALMNWLDVRMGLTRDRRGNKQRRQGDDNDV